MEIGGVIKLENNTKYAIAEIVNVESATYYYLVNIDNVLDIKFGIVENDIVNFVEDNNLFQKLLLLVCKNKIEKDKLQEVIS